MSEHLHNGHRQRMRTRILTGGIGNLQEHEVLEYLLYSFIPRKDTNALAHTLIKEFGSLYDIFNAKPEHLQTVSGMTENAGLFLSVIGEIVRTYGLHPSVRKKVFLRNRGEVKEYFGRYFIGLNEEQFCAVALDAKCRVAGEKHWNSGNRTSVSFSVAEIISFAQATKAVEIIIAHNHPSGRLNPSNEDVRLTRNIVRTLDALGINLQDHLIFGDAAQNPYSFEEVGYFKEFKDEIIKFNEVFGNYE